MFFTGRFVSRTIAAETRRRKKPGETRSDVEDETLEVKKLPGHV
jgi:hypothetical protein